MKLSHLSLSVMSFFSFYGSVYASEIEFKAPITESKWEITENNKLTCKLVHEIPDYGFVSFSSVAGKNTNLNLSLRPIREPKDSVSVEVRAVAPNYRPGVPDENLTFMKSYKYFSGELNDKDAWTVADVLSQSKNVAFLYNDWYFQNKLVQVTLSAINFKKNYRDFLGCVNNLLKYNFDDISFTVVNFKPNSEELTDESKIKLDRLITYISLDHSVDALVIDSFTDSYGTAANNKKISEEKALIIGNYIAKSGIGKDLISTNGYGEKQHIIDNSNESNRNRNRRVIIRVEPSRDVKLNNDLSELWNSSEDNQQTQKSGSTDKKVDTETSANNKDKKENTAETK